MQRPFKVFLLVVLSASIPFRDIYGDGFYLQPPSPTSSISPAPTSADLDDLFEDDFYLFSPTTYGQSTARATHTPKTTKTVTDTNPDITYQISTSTKTKTHLPAATTFAKSTTSATTSTSKYRYRTMPSPKKPNGEMPTSTSSADSLATSDYISLPTALPVTNLDHYRSTATTDPICFDRTEVITPTQIITIVSSVPSTTDLSVNYSYHEPPTSNISPVITETSATPQITSIESGYPSFPITTSLPLTKNDYSFYDFTTSVIEPGYPGTTQSSPSPTNRVVVPKPRIYH